MPAGCCAEWFDVMKREQVDPAGFRRMMGRFATGVTVITVQHGDLMHGMTANAFSSLSLEPPLMLVCIGRESRMAGLLAKAGAFSVNFLSADQEAVSRQFAGRDRELGARTEWLQRGPVAPLVPRSLGAISCAIENTYDGGDHWIVVGRVLELHEPDPATSRMPLLFYESRYADLRERRPGPLTPVEDWSNDAILIYHDEWSSTDEEPPEEYVRAHIWE